MAQRNGNPGRTKFRWKKDPVSADPYGQEIHVHRMTCSTGETAWMERVDTGPPVYHAEIRGKDGTNIASVWIHCNLADSKDEVEKRTAAA